MERIDANKIFKPINIAVLVVSDTRSDSTDKSGKVLAERVASAGHNLAEKAIVKDDRGEILSCLKQWLASPQVDVVIATGGTGLTGRDITPDVFASVYEKEIVGFGELFRWISFAKIGTSTMQSRASGGIAAGKYLFCLPGSPGACRDAWDEILRWQLDNRHQPCNLVDVMPRLQEHKPL